MGAASRASELTPIRSAMPALARLVADLAVLVATMLFAGPASAQVGDPGAGVPLELARERARLIRDLRYDVTLAIPANKSEPIVGRSVVRFRWADATLPLVLDFDPGHARAVEVRSNGAPVPATSAKFSC